jgi:methylmalonyl-CoA mutase
VAIITSSTKAYAEHAAQAVAELRAAGAERVLVAGRARELPEDVRVDGEVYDGMDVVAFLRDVLDRIGAPAEGAGQ